MSFESKYLFLGQMGYDHRKQEDFFNNDGNFLSKSIRKYFIIVLFRYYFIQAALTS